MLGLAVTSEFPVAASNYEPLGRKYRVKADRELDSLVNEGLGFYEPRRRARGKSEKVFVPSSHGLVRQLLHHWEKVYTISSPEDRRVILRDMAEAVQKSTLGSKSFMEKFRRSRQAHPFLYADVKTGPIRLESILDSAKKPDSDDSASKPTSEKLAG